MAVQYTPYGAKVGGSFGYARVTVTGNAGESFNFRIPNNVHGAACTDITIQSLPDSGTTITLDGTCDNDPENAVDFINLWTDTTPVFHFLNNPMTGFQVTFSAGFGKIIVLAA